MNWSAEQELELVRLVEVEHLTHEEAARRISPLELTRGAVQKKIRRLRDAGRLEKLRRELGGRTGVTEIVALNEKEISSKSKRIKTLEQLLEAAQVDLSVWYVERHKINKWEVGAKASHKDLTFTGGKIDGTILEEGLTVEPLFQVTAWLRRIKLIPIFPPVQPILCEETSEYGAQVESGLLRTLVVADPQFGFSRNVRTGELVPFHDDRVLNICLQLAELANVDRIDILGDLLDLPDWTDRFIRLPELTEVTQPALLAAYAWLKAFRDCRPNADIVVYEGNHDKRMKAAIARHLSAAYELRAVDELELPPALSVPKLLALHKLGIRWVGDFPLGVEWLNEGIRLTHGDGQLAAKSVANAVDTTEVYGHAHRVEMFGRAVRTRGKSRVVLGCCIGCACHVDGRVPGSKLRQQWHQGCALIDYNVGGSEFTIHPIVIDNGVAVWDRKVIRG